MKCYIKVRVLALILLTTYVVPHATCTCPNSPGTAFKNIYSDFYFDYYFCFYVPVCRWDQTWMPKDHTHEMLINFEKLRRNRGGIQKAVKIDVFKLCALYTYKGRRTSQNI